MKYLVVVALVVVVSSVLVSGRSTHLNRIVNGSPAVRGQAPYQVSLRTLLNLHFCGGAVLTQQWILTAGHCTAGRYARQFQAVVGTLSSTEGTSHRIGKVILHEDFAAETLSNDIALLETETRMIFNNLVQPVRLGRDYVEQDTKALLTGWGQTSFPGNLAADLQAIAMRTLSNEECEKAHQESEGHPPIRDFNICAESENEGGACMGDSGSPLVDLSNEIIGLVSWGVPCGKMRPDVFTRVALYRDWIVESVNNNK